MSPISPLKSQLFSEAACPPEGQYKRPRGRIAVRTLQVLYNEFPNVLQPKQIAAHAKVSYEAVKKWLQRADGFLVRNEGNGWYRARATVQLLRRIGLDPMMVHAVGVKLPSLPGGLPPRLQGLGTPVRGDPDTRRTEYLGRLVTVQAQADGGHFVQVRASTKPFTVAEFMELAAWLDGLAAPGKAMLSKVDFNVDGEDHRVQISGLESMQLGDWTSAYVKAYNKEAIRATRIEACFHRLDLGMVEVAKLLNELATPPRPDELPYKPELNGPFHPWEAT